MKLQTSINMRSTKPSLNASGSRQPRDGHSRASTTITAGDLIQVREPLGWKVRPGKRTDVAHAVPKLKSALRGVTTNDIVSPPFLLAHQREAFLRTLETLRTFGGACLCDAVGLGKTYVSLAIASRYRKVTTVLPATIVSQWQRAAEDLGIRTSIITHESFSRANQTVHESDLIIVDEAHRFRNPGTRRYDRLSRSVGRSHVLLVTATPIVNSPRDLLNLLRLFLPDHVLSPFGTRSLERSLAGRVTMDTLKAATPLIIARSASSANVPAAEIPKTVDTPVTACAPIDDDTLQHVLRQIEYLEFPSFEGPEAARLLRSHLCYRLHSSIPALQSTLERHRAYLERAIAAAASGNLLTRRDARLIFDPDDRQLDLQLVYDAIRSGRGDASRLRTERDHLDQLLATINGSGKINPKLQYLMSYLEKRDQQKTIVFVNAVPTATEVAARLAWKRVAVVTGGRARIASGPLSLEETLTLFSPRSNGSRPDQLTDVRVLITTDVLSEGVNLQDADAVVHYDLPWTPLRLQQRIGRVSRLGSRFREVTVRWFAPAPPLEQRLGLCRRLDQKLEQQLEHGVPVSSGLGKAHVANHALEEREDLSRGHHDSSAEPDGCHAVVRAPHVAAYAIRWLTDSGYVSDIMVVSVHPEPLIDLHEICHTLRQLFDAPMSTAPIPKRLHANARSALRRRLADGLAGPEHPQVRRITRSIVAVAKRLRGGQKPSLLHSLDQVLGRIHQGTRIGAELELIDLLEGGDLSDAELQRWLTEWKSPSLRIHGVVVDAIVFGDGTG